MRHRSFLLAGLALALSAPAAGAWDRSPYGAYAPGGYGGYGFAGNAVGGAYLGAPLTRFPSPSAIVPPTWTYGTYGVPTMTGIRQAPVADPKIYVVHGVGRPSFGRTVPPVFDPQAEAAPGGPRIVSVTVPRR